MTKDYILFLGRGIILLVYTNDNYCFFNTTVINE